VIIEAVNVNSNDDAFMINAAMSGHDKNKTGFEYW